MQSHTLSSGDESVTRKVAEEEEEEEEEASDADSADDDGSGSAAVLAWVDELPRNCAAAAKRR